MDKAAAAREILLLGALAELRAAAAGAPVLALKGAALLELGLFAPGERGMADADVLVRGADLPALERALAGLGFAPMPHSAEAWLRPSPGAVPPAVIDVHTALWHVPDMEEFFARAVVPSDEGPALGLPDLFLHAASHPLLRHGEFLPRNLEDCLRLARRGAGTGGGAFWGETARLAEAYRLRAVLAPALSRLSAAGAVPAGAAAALAPRGAEKLAAALFERAARRRSSALEYLLPALHRPALAWRCLAPERKFMLRRYGAAGPAAYLMRPLRMLGNLLRGN